ncbi:sigma 54-interacting transcriptional regulator [Salinibius halmophilus]|uniref:sigma 54-interacting transcriptional regulator n=1 Tax=Salinibius halmophilus TaxID=1853216 RepID=UPI000E6680DC|nr:sigma 54-interacting transcriptional regulator [Salinibius halmophilus]
MKQEQRMIGHSLALSETLEQVTRLAPINRPVMILGERGTGKELIAERLHFLSQRWDEEFIKLNCAAFSENLLDAELFGHDSGAFTGATKSRAGVFERAHGGSLLLDELGTMDARVQEKLLRVIEYGELTRLGGQQARSVDVRLITSTNENLEQAMDEGRFRADLIDRLTFAVIHVPPLRERKDDIPDLADHFAMKMAIELGHEQFSGFSSTAMEQLMDWHWPGNIRELKNTIERSVALNDDPSEPVEHILLDPLRKPNTGSTSASTEGNTKLELPEQIDFQQHIAEYEQAVVYQIFRRQQGNQQTTADALGLTYHQLRAWFKRHNIQPKNWVRPKNA